MTVASPLRYQSDRVHPKGDHAVVVGASMAGLFAAWVLADAYGTVTIVDGDDLPDGPDARDGVPQGEHPHLLLKSGQQTIEDFFPGFCEELLVGGGLLLDWTTDIRYYEEGGFIAGGPTRVPMYAASRPLFESIVRRRVGQLDGIELRENCGFRCYETTPTEDAVTGIEIWNEDGSTERVGGDLVVDATGRASRTAPWLETLGYESPPVDEVDVDVAYGTVRVERPEDDRRMFFVPPSAPRTMGGGAFPVENDRWLVTLVGMHETTPPTDPGPYLDFARELPVPEIGRILETYEWVDGTISQYRFPSSVWRHYESLDRFPDGLLVVGDAVASYNPIYGQGMSIAALGALQLHDLLATDPDPSLPLAFFERNARFVRTAWRLSVGADFQFSQTTGPKPFWIDVFNWYVSRLLRNAQSDGVLANRFARVAMMESDPKTLVHPDTVFRVLRPRRS